MKQFVTIIAMMLVLGAALAQPSGPSAISINPAYYFHLIELVADSGRTTILAKEYTQFKSIPEGETVLGTFPAGTLHSIEGKGAHPQLGYEWDKREMLIGSDTISLNLFTRVDSFAVFPDAIAPFAFSFPITNLAPGTYRLMLCQKKLGTIIIK